MDQEIEKLIKKYFEGNTSLEEEKKLKSFFAQDTVPRELEKYRHYFDLLNKEKSVSAKEVDFQPPAPKSRFYHLHSFRNWSVAAVIVLLVGLGLVLDMYRTQPDQQEVNRAFDKTKYALNYAGYWFGKGMSETGELKYFQEAVKNTEKLDYYNQTEEKLDKLNAFNKGYQKMTLITNFTNYQPYKN